MKTVEENVIKADSVITEVRRAKLVLAQKYRFDVRAMVRALRERDEQEGREPCASPNGGPAASDDSSNAPSGPPLVS